jgi:hypothetical protein
MSAEIVLQNLGQRLSQNFFETLISPFVDTLGVPLLSLMVFGSIGLAYYQVQQSIIIPLVSLLLIGSVTITRAPQSARNAIVALATVSIASIGYVLYTRARER